MEPSQKIKDLLSECSQTMKDIAKKQNNEKRYVTEKETILYIDSQINAMNNYIFLLKKKKALYMTLRDVELSQIEMDALIKELKSVNIETMLFKIDAEIMAKDYFIRSYESHAKQILEK
jgi:hypothetical protein